MALVVESVSSVDYALGTTTVIPKPTGLSEGDLMIALLASGDTDIHSRSTLSGWTLLQNNGFFSSSRGVINAQYKIADSSDVAASNFTFLTNVDAAQAGTILRISGAPQSSEAIEGSETDSTTSGTTISFTAAQTPFITNSLAVVAHLGFGTAATGNISAYSSTPSLTFTEASDYDYDYAGDSSLDMIFGVAYAVTTDTQITAYGCTYSATKSPGGILILVTPQADASADISHLSIPPTIESVTGSNTATANVSHLAIPPTIEPVLGESTSDQTQWTNPDKPNTSWTNQDKP